MAAGKVAEPLDDVYFSPRWPLGMPRPPRYGATANEQRIAVERRAQGKM